MNVEEGDRVASVDVIPAAME